ncbi:MAG: TolC family protein [Acidobacteriota bacterium]
MTITHQHRLRKIRIESPGRRTLAAAVGFSALLVTGCAGVGTPDPAVRPVAVPDAWAGAGGDLAAQPPEPGELAAWWRRLDDPVLDDLVERTLLRNFDLEIGVTRLDEARALRGLSRADLGPSVSATAGAGRSEALGDLAPSTYRFSASVEISWVADLFGANRRAFEASQADLEAEVENLRALRASLAAETVAAYADLRVAQARLRVLDRSLESRVETSQLVNWREQAGLASRLEVNQVLSQLDQARAGRPLNERAETDARLRLHVLAGATPGTLDELLAAPAEDPSMPEPPESIAVGIPAEALRQRPDVRAAERELEAAWARLGTARADRLPKLQLTGSLDADSTELADVFDLDSLFANLLAGLTAPIFQSGRIAEGIAVQEARWRRAAVAYESTVLGALAEVEGALVAFRSARSRMASLDAASRAAAEAAELADQRYEAGLVDLLSVLDTEQTVFSSEEQLEIARGDLLTAFSTLYRAVGGGWNTEWNLDSEGEGDSDA